MTYQKGLFKNDEFKKPTTKGVEPTTCHQTPYRDISDHGQGSLYYRPKQGTIRGNSLKISIYLHCLIPPKWVIYIMIPDGGRMNSPILKHYVSCRKTASSRGLRRLRIFHLLDGLGALYADLFLYPFQVLYPYNMFCPQHLHWNPFKTKKTHKEKLKGFSNFQLP